MLGVSQFVTGWLRQAQAINPLAARTVGRLADLTVRQSSGLGRTSLVGFARGRLARAARAAQRWRTPFTL